MRLHDLVSGLIILSGAALLGTTVAAQSTKSLTLEDAERIAIQNHPQIQVAREMAVAADQMVRQARSAYYLTANGSLSGAYAEHASRIAAGGAARGASPNAKTSGGGATTSTWSPLFPARSRAWSIKAPTICGSGSDLASAAKSS